MRIVGQGIDLVAVARIRRLLDEHQDRFLNRCFTPEEQAHAQGRRRAAEHLAARFAAKEAAMKALGTGLSAGIAWTDIAVEVLPTGQPTLRVVRAAEQIAKSLNISNWVVSLSHTDDYAIASVIATSDA